MSIKKVNIFYLIVLLLFMTVGYLVQSWNLMYGLIITEVGLVLIPSLVFLFISNAKPAEFIRFRGLKFSLVPYVVGIMISGWFIAEFIGIVSTFLLSKIINIPPQPLPPPKSAVDLVVGLLIVAGLAAFCEEILMRGVIFRVYERKGETFAIIMSGFLFAILHLNPTNFFSIWFLGIILAYMVYRTDSIFAGMIAHFTNNGLALIILYLVTTMLGGELPPVEAGQAVVTPEVLLAWVVIVIPFIILFLFLLRGFNKRTANIMRADVQIDGTAEELSDYWPIALAAIVYVVRCSFFV
ncbi:CPBP family intramembrane glutamic endopeptidase [Calorimonas adulescens]|uniref:CPBP family intramembrane metalloprotease n=1 Tax=Calorimonas adulescens TaxID=2606906 RepID=A0A5D8QDK2_9THEO|nr:type II CAAX endopeptidase family protein [Calorimonas adulescens]TZE81388.1 CPBP family intramembrane metalloprotease [Calorimonas adulescens]